MNTYVQVFNMENGSTMYRIAQGGQLSAMLSWERLEAEITRQREDGWTVIFLPTVLDNLR